MFRSPLQRLAMRLHLAGEATTPLSETGMELATYLNLGVAGAGFIALLFAGAAPWLAFPAAVVTFVLLSVALFHRIACWVSILLGAALASGIGGGLGALFHPGGLGLAIGASAGLLVAGLTYGPFVAAALRRAP